MNLQVETIRKLLQSGDKEKAESLLIRLAEVARGAYTDIQEPVLALKAVSSESWAFLPASKRYLNDFQTQYGIHTELVIESGLNNNNFEPAAEIQILRVIQEAMTNARKHSRAKNIRVVISQEESLGRITIIDNGSGFDVGQIDDAACGHFGLTFMSERMAQIGGSMKIDSQPSAGTVVEREAPILRSSEAQEST